MRTSIFLSLTCLGAIACAPADDASLDAGPPVDAGKPLSAMPAIADLEGETWHAIEPGGDTICSRGQPWAFFFRPGVVNKLVVEFQGGGACWNYPTCSVADMIFKDNIDDIRGIVLGDACASDSDCAEDSECLTSGYCRRPDPERGIYDHSNDDNPVKGWNHLFIPYCTGDIHWGRSVVEYASEGGAAPFMLNHQGAVNAEVALRWVRENVPQAGDHLYRRLQRRRLWCDRLGTSRDARLPGVQGGAAWRLRRRHHHRQFLARLVPGMVGA